MNWPGGPHLTGAKADVVASTSSVPPLAAPMSARSRLRVTALRAVVFLLLFMALQAGWEAARGSWAERLWVQQLTVGGATLVINTITPAAQAHAQGTRIVAPGGGLNVLLGCEGTDVVFLLVAAFCVFAMPWRWRLGGMLLALLIAYALNLIRIVGLFYAYRSDASLFDLLHTAGAPLLMVACSGLYFHAWLALAVRSADRGAGTGRQTASSAPADTSPGAAP
jgi:exosortase family protein XrtM